MQALYNFVTSAEEVMFSSAFFCLLAGLCKTKFGEKAARGPRKKPSDFGVNPNHVSLGLG